MVRHFTVNEDYAGSSPAIPANKRSVAQMAEATGLDPVCWEFDSPRSDHCVGIILIGREMRL